MAKPPAFQFYPLDFMNGVKFFTLPERGAYISLLCEQWDAGAVSDRPQDLARLFGCSKREAEKVWSVVGRKFDKGDDGLYRNARLECERQKQFDFRQMQSDRGKASAARRNRALTEPPTKPQPSGVPNGQPEGNPKPESNSLSLSSSLSSDRTQPSDLTTSTPSGRSSSPLTLSPLRFAKLQETHAFVGSRLRVPHVLHDELRTKLGGQEPHQRLMDWYGSVNVEADEQGLPIIDVFKFLRPRFEIWASLATADAELERFRPKGA